ncbi:hypothetical protein Pla175_04440 [Pirellulimonas nuda]|uniref:Uncharacterized protein n=1 Tax=Pirellulimonas nuda TaxID=2528009 RepID=A0A518D6M1_9BACT|nr:hypothetical protein [Pirellulimonas nuda]QDU87089.1 hypothetical protein Pla175_04440 [Pirellulimonas nuda]
MNSYSEVRRVRHAMSAAAGHDIRRLIAEINARRSEASHRIIDPGTKAEQCDAPDAAASDVAAGAVARG